VGALRDIKCDMAARRASLQKLIVHEVETRIFQVADAAAESGAAAVVPSAAAAQKAHLRSARPALYGFQSLCFSSLNALSQMLSGSSATLHSARIKESQRNPAWQRSLLGSPS